MKCEDIVHAIPLYLYGELSSANEEMVEDHVAKCAACARELEVQKALHSALDAREAPLPGGLLQECRGDLTRNIVREAALTRSSGNGSVFDWLREIFHHGIPLRIPIGAMAMIAVGYLGARITNPTPFGGVSTNNADAGIFTSAIRAIEPQSSGNVRITLDEIHRREVVGSLNEDKIQRLLVAAVRDENNPGVRVESVGMLKECAQSSPVRAALLDAVRHDPNAGVRLKALEGLKAFASEASVRQALADVLLRDDNPGVRIEAIDVLTRQHDDAMVGILQNVFQKEDNHYVRTRVQNALQEMHATPGTF